MKYIKSKQITSGYHVTESNMILKISCYLIWSLTFPKREFIFQLYGMHFASSESNYLVKNKAKAQKQNPKLWFKNEKKWVLRYAFGSPECWGSLNLARIAHSMSKLISKIIIAKITVRGLKGTKTISIIFYTINGTEDSIMLNSIYLYKILSSSFLFLHDLSKDGINCDRILIKKWPINSPISTWAVYLMIKLNWKRKV